MRTFRHYTEEECEWIEQNYLSMNWQQMEDAFQEKFGYYRCGKTIRRKGYNMGFRKMHLGINSSWNNPYRAEKARINKAGGVVDYFLKGNI